jgi:hypothetical protein
MCKCKGCADLPAHPYIPNKHINPATGLPPTHEWGAECGRGWVSCVQFARGTDSIIPRTDRSKTRKVYQSIASTSETGRRYYV